MAERLDEFPKHTVRYAWDEWLDGGVWKLRAGTDFHVSPKAFRSMAYATGTLRGLKVKISIIDGDVVIQARPPDKGAKTDG